MLNSVLLKLKDKISNVCTRSLYLNTGGFLYDNPKIKSGPTNPEKLIVRVCTAQKYRDKVFHNDWILSNVCFLKLKQEKEEKKKIIENYTSERAMRKKYYNMVEEMKGVQILKLFFFTCPVWVKLLSNVLAFC